MILLEGNEAPRPDDNALVARRSGGSQTHGSLARRSTGEFYAERAEDGGRLGSSSQEGSVEPWTSTEDGPACSRTSSGRSSRASTSADDLEVVCMIPPHLGSEDNAERIMLAVGDAVGSALHRVSSQFGLVNDASHCDQSCSPSWLGRGWTRDPPARRCMRQVRTSPSLLALAGGVEPTQSARSPGSRAGRAGHLTTTAHWDSGARWPGGHISDVPVAGLLGGGASVIWQRSVPDFQEGGGVGDAESGVMVVATCGGSLPPGTGMPLPLNPLLRRNPQVLRRMGSDEGSRSTCALHIERSAPQLLNLAPARCSVQQNVEHAAESRSSILDFEHLFCQFYVGITLKRRRKCVADFIRCGSAISKATKPCLPDALTIAKAWKTEALECLWNYRAEFQRRWPGMSLPKSRASFERKLEPLFEAEVSWQDELRGPHKRLVLALEPERICHRLLWAVGDAIPPEQILFDIQRGLKKRFPHCNIRCADGLWSSAGIFQILMILFTLLLLLGVRSLVCAVPAAQQAMAVPISPKGHNIDVTVLSREERMDQLAARVLLTGSLLQLWLLHAVAAAFPLRSLHSPFRRDLGCLAAYSRTASVLFRYLGPLAALPLPVAMAIRWNRMGRWVGKIAVLLVPTAERQVGWHTLSFCWAASLPVLTTAAAWSVRSSLYSHHHLFITLTFLCHLTAALFFAVSFELVKWAVLGVGGIIAIGVLLFARYTAEFTNGSLLKAAQLQWACAHVVPILGVVLAAALEVEAGVAMALIDYICESQDIIPVKMCIRMLRSSC